MHEDIRVIARPPDIESLAKKNATGKWKEIIRKVQGLRNTECVVLDVAGADKKRITAIRTGIRLAGKRAKIPEGKLRIGYQNDTIYVWKN